MSGKNAEEIVVGANGSLRIGPVDADFPLTPTAPTPDHIDLGYLSEDGVKVMDGKTVVDIKAWQSFYALRKIISEREFTIASVLRQWSAGTFPLAFGGGEVTAIDGYEGMWEYVPPAPEELDERSAILDWADGDRNYRLIIYRCMVSENVETNILRTGPADLPVTLALIGQDNGDPWKFMTDDPAFDPEAE